MNKKVLIISAAILLLIGGVFAFNSSTKDGVKENGLTITHTLGETVLKKENKNVVVLDYGILDSLDAMGVEVIGVPQSGSVPQYLEKYTDEKYKNAGSIKEPDLEAIHKMNPDIIFMSGRMGDYYDQLSEIAPTVYVENSNENYLEKMKENYKMFGEIFDVKDKADELISNLLNKAESVNARVKDSNKNASIIMLNGRTISAFGQSSRYGIIHNELGFSEADQKLDNSTHGMEVTFEYLSNVNPDYLFVVDRNTVVSSNNSSESSKSVIENELMKNTDAYLNGNIVYLDSVIWYTVSGGYNSTLKMIEEVQNAI